MSSKSIITPLLVIFMIGLVEFTRHQLSSSHDFIDNEKDAAAAVAATTLTQHFHDTKGMEKPISPPKLLTSDLIYNDKRNTVPIVNEEYNIIFFQVAKVASSEWSRFFIRLHNDDSNLEWCSNDRIHDHNANGLKYLSDYSIKEAREMMLSPDWTKAIFVRHPKPRILSAFLDKAVEKSDHFVQETCKRYQAKGKSYDDCIYHHEDFDFFLHEITTTLKDNVHWRSIYSRVDEKWWPYINYIGNMDNLSDDAKTLLQSIHSNKTGVSAWDKIGTSGWSDNERDCESTKNSDGEFLAKRDVIHTTRASEKMLKYYTPKLEQFVEDHYADDLDNIYYDFDPIHLFKVDKHP